MKLLSRLRHFFVPHHSNNHKAKLLHPSVLVVLVAFFLVYQFGINFALIFQPSILGFATNISPERVVELTNQERLKAGLSPLKLNGTLNQAAQMKAGDMFAFDYWAHNSPSGRTPWEFFKEAGYSYLYAGENLARDFMNSESVVAAWMNSPTHRDNILNDRYKEIGLAVVNGSLNGVETTLVVQMFGTPTPAPVAQVPAESIVEPVEAAILQTQETAGAKEPEVFETGEPLVEEETSLVPTTFVSSGEKMGAPLVSPFGLTKTLAVLMMGVILGVLVVDAFLVYKKKVVRLSGKNLAHLLFIGTMLLMAILTMPGAIL